MNVEELRDFCISLPSVKENCPWTEPQYVNLVTFTIGDKWFCLLDPDKKFIDIKASPEKIAELLERYTGAFPAWHMNKKHWIGITLESDIPDSLITQFVEEAYILVKSHLSKNVQL